LEPLSKDLDGAILDGLDGAILHKLIYLTYLSHKTLALSYTGPSRGKAFPPHPKSAKQKT